MIHVAMWIAYVALEYLANIYHIREGSELQYLKSVMITLPLIMVPTYFLVWVVVPRFLKPGKILPTVISFLLVFVFVFYGRVLWLDVMNNFRLALFEHIPVGKIFKNVIRDYSVIALAVCIYILADWRQKEKINIELIKAKAEAELNLLKGQLHPHFLFNTLNNIYSLALIKSELTGDAILKLTDLLDYMVYKANAKSVPLSKEVQLINTYLDLESLRHSDKLVIERNIDVSNIDIPVVPLVMLPFVENCFKHGGPGLDGIFKIQISVLYENNCLTFNIVNTIRKGLGQFDSVGASRSTAQGKGLSQGDPAKGGPGHDGVGLDNIRKRLNLVYPDRHRLEIESKEENYKVDLTIIYSDEV